MLAACGIQTEIQLDKLFANVDRAAVIDRRSYKFPPGRVRMTDDLLLSVLAEDYIGKISSLGGDAQRTTKLRHRLDKLLGS